MKILITGTAGFIGFHLKLKMIAMGWEVVGLDCINDYYDPNLKYDRLKYAGIDKAQILYNQLVTSNKFSNYRFIQLQLEDKPNLENLFATEKFDMVCNLAAQAGVRYSLTNPKAYIDSNIIGFLNILECCRYNQTKNLVYASSSSVYGLNASMPFSTSHNVDHPISLYAASKKSNELMAHTYSHLFGIPTSGLRFFTVYGPWGRPDMALFLFTKAMIANEPIQLFNNGEMERDFTYIDDIVDGIVKVIENPAMSDKNWDPLNPDPSASMAPYSVFNIGNSKPVKLLNFISEIEKNLGKKAILEKLPMQPGDVAKTWADISPLNNKFNFQPKTSIEEGVKNFIAWYKQYYQIL